MSSNCLNDVWHKLLPTLINNGEVDNENITEHISKLVQEVGFYNITPEGVSDVIESNDRFLLKI